MPLAGPSLWSPCPSSPTSSTPVPPRVLSGTASLRPPETSPHGSLAGPILQGTRLLAIQEPWHSLRGRWGLGGPVPSHRPGPFRGQQREASRAPTSADGCSLCPPHPAWGAGSRLRPAEDAQAIFSGNKCREIALTGEQPLFQANFHIIESNDFLSLLPAPLHLTNCKRDLIQGLKCRDK